RSSRTESATVTLFADTFTNHYDPEIGAAAVTVLERGGERVRVVRPGCCGRPLISQGLLDEARTSAERLVQAMDSPTPLLFLEPSCLSAIKDDIPDLVRPAFRSKAKEIAALGRLYDDYASTLDLKLKAHAGKILLHGHCHQKSMGLLEATKKLLGKIPNADIV